MEILYKITVFFLALVLMANYSFAFGSSVKNDIIKINDDESALFKLLFWGNNEEIELSIKEYPENWAVIIDPEKIFINESNGQEYVYINDLMHSANVVSVFVKPSSSNSGNVIISAVSKVGGSNIAMFQERYFNLSVIPSYEYKIQNTEMQQKNNSDVNVSDSFNNTIIKESEKKENFTIAYATIIAAIIMVSIFLYKR